MEKQTKTLLDTELTEFINEKVFDALNKIGEIGKESPKVSEALQDILEIVMLSVERQNKFNQRTAENFNGFASDVAYLANAIQGGVKTDGCGSPDCCQTTSQPKKNIEVSDEIKGLADDLFGGTTQTGGYQDYINNNKKKTKEYVADKSGIQDEEKLTENLDVLSDFIEENLQKRN